MSDENDISSTENTTPAPEAPVSVTKEEIAAIVTAAIDARIPGMQSGYDKQIADLKTEIRQSTMDEGEIETEANADLQAQLIKSNADNAALLAAQTYPDAYKVFTELNAAPDAEAQLKLLSQLQKAAEAPAPPAEEVPETPAATAPASVDPNNSRTPSDDGGEMTAEKASSILKSFGSIWPGHGG